MLKIRLSLPSRIILTILLSGLAALGTGGFIGYKSGLDAMDEGVANRLTGQREIKREWIESYLRDQIRFTDAIGGSPEIIEATRELRSAFRGMHDEVSADPAAMARNRAALEEWYTKKFFPRIDKVAGSHLPLEGILPTDPVARRLQADYIAGNPYPLGHGSDMAMAPGGSRYDIAHAKYHPALKRMADTIGFYDINLMDAATGDVFYTVAKEADFGSNMYHGAYQRSGFAQVAARALDPRNGGRTVIQDYDSYMPSAFLPQMFTAVPIVDNGHIIAVLVAQIDISRLNDMLTDSEGWAKTGQGETGEVQLIGEDHMFRSQSRFMATQPEQFLAKLSANGIPSAFVDRTRSLGTTILALRAATPQVDLALHNQTGIGRFNDVRGEDVIFAYGLVEIEGLRWVILAKQDAAEAFAPAVKLHKELLVAAAAAAIVLTFIAMVFSTVFARPLRRVIDGMRTISSDSGAALLEVKGNDEFAELTRGFNDMALAIIERDRTIANANAKADGLLNDLYPTGLAERIRNGAILTVETVVNTTTVVTWIEGLDKLTATHGAADLRDILEALMSAINGTAAIHAVEPIGSLGEIHVAVCGLSAPRLDHANSVLTWTSAATRAVQRLNTDWARAISLHFGVESGEIDVMLLKRGHAAFDVWGRALSVARRIALEADPGCVLVGESAYALLTDVGGFQPGPMAAIPAVGIVPTWSRPALASVNGETSGLAGQTTESAV